MSQDCNNEDNTRSFNQLLRDTVIGHYRIIEKIGAGGMGEVYLADDTDLERKVALKFLPLNLCHDADCRARFKREAQAAAKLDHPNIVDVHEVGEYQGRPFFSMQHVEGRSLKEVLAGKALPFETILEVGIQICDGLHAAHEKGVTHRDIKPSNILIDSHGRARIVDFGLASVLGKDQLTKTGSTLGTIGYMSPEQVRGDKVDHRSDIFSFGVVLYEMITGQAPFKAETEAATLHAITDAKPEMLARFRREVPATLQSVIDKALDKDVTTRYQHADGLVADLKKERNRLVAPGGSVSKPGRRPMRYAIMGSVVFVLAVLAMVMKPWRFEVSSTQEAVAQENRLAIMYFDNLANPADSARLGEITTNLLIAGLSESQYLQIVSSQRLYDLLKLLGKEGIKRVDRDMATQVAKKAGAKWMVLGSVLQVEPELIVTAQLVDAVTGDVKASKRINGSGGEKIFPVVDRLIAELRNDLSLPAAAKTEVMRPVAEVTTNSPEAYRYYLEGMDYQYRFDFEIASEKFGKSLQLDSTLIMAYYWIAYNYVGTGEGTELLTKASRFLDKATEKEKRYLQSLQDRAAGNYQSAITKLEKIIKQYPDDKEAYWAITDIYTLVLNQGTDAIPYLLKVIEIDSLYKPAYNSLAYAYNDAGDFEKAIWAINKYISLAPDEFNPYDTRGEIYALNGRLVEAIASYEKAVAIAPDDAQAQNSLGHMYLYNREYSRADSCFRKLISRPEKGARSGARRSLAFVQMYQGKFSEALRLLDDGAAADRLESYESAMIVKLLDKVFIFEELNHFDSALSLVKRIMEIGRRANPDDKFYFRDFYVRVLAKNHDCATAERVCLDIKKDVDAENVSSMAKYSGVNAMVDYCMGKFDSALGWTVKAALGGSYFEARICLESGNLAKAISIYEERQSTYDLLNRIIVPIADVTAYYYLGLAYEKSGWNSKAIEQYRTFLDIWKDADPGLTKVDDARARILLPISA